MNLSAPKQVTWLIALILGIIGLIAQLVTIPVLSGLAFWLVLVALVVMLVATYLPGL
jgi:type IV secretory pathway TrbD component